MCVYTTVKPCIYRQFSKMHVKRWRNTRMPSMYRYQTPRAGHPPPKTGVDRAAFLGKILCHYLDKEDTWNE